MGRKSKKTQGVTVQKPSRVARKAANQIAAILEEYLDTLPAAEKLARLKAFHESVRASFEARATRAKRPKIEVPVFARVAARR